MKKQNFVKKPFVTLFVVIFIVAAIFYIELQKPDLSKVKIPEQEKTEKDKKYPRAPDFIGIEKWINSEAL